MKTIFFSRSQAQAPFALPVVGLNSFAKRLFIGFHMRLYFVAFLFLSFSVTANEKTPDPVSDLNNAIEMIKKGDLIDYFKKYVHTRDLQKFEKRIKEWGEKEFISYYSKRMPHFIEFMKGVEKNSVQYFEEHGHKFAYFSLKSPYQGKHGYSLVLENGVWKSYQRSEIDEDMKKELIKSGKIK